MVYCPSSMVFSFMNLREEILREHSKNQCTRIVHWVGSSQKRFDELFSLFLHDEYRVVQRAAWAVGNCVIDHPGLIKDHFRKLLDNLDKPNLHTSIKRNSIRLLEEIDIPEVYHGQVMDICLRFLESPAERVAVKAYSLSVLNKMSKLYPEIMPEIKLLIEDQMDTQTAAFKSRARKFLKESF